MLIIIKHKGEEYSSSIIQIISNDSFLDSNILFKNVNHKLNTFYTKNKFHHTCQIFQRFSLMDGYQFIFLFIQMLKDNINTLFPSYKHLLFQNHGDFVVRQHVKVKPSLGHFDKNVLSHIIPIETGDVFPVHFFSMVVLINLLSLKTKIAF